MPKVRTAKIADLKEKLKQRITGGYYLPGSRFPSNREIAQRFDVSYQTADNLIREIVDEGLLHRIHGSGTYLLGESFSYQGARLIFPTRARRKGSFGDLLKTRLHQAFAKAGIPLKSGWDKGKKLGPYIPIVWEQDVGFLKKQSHNPYAVLLNQTPPQGLIASYIDAVLVDDFSGGMAAGELASEQCNPTQPVVLAGPQADSRCQNRVQGFKRIHPKAKVIYAPTWFYRDGLPIAAQVLKLKPDLVFCANDRLAQALCTAIRKSRNQPPKIIGFDNAPIAEELDLTTIAIPWNEMVENVLDIIQKRMAGDNATASQRILAPRPIRRKSL